MQIGASSSTQPGWGQPGGNHESTIGDSQGEFANFEELQAEYRDLQKIPHLCDKIMQSYKATGSGGTFKMLRRLKIPNEVSLKPTGFPNLQNSIFDVPESGSGQISLAELVCSKIREFHTLEHPSLSTINKVWNFQTEIVTEEEYYSGMSLSYFLEHK
ncbi:unnamed protein product [Moneuplotes crassus]|uniref:Uncharacterized protein n=1 Tax=Euplotes crassus TaxID=5936 RepID=A0AAD1X1X1_EUPCR|nr:unnamed protein product [Moneuplotes crassus]